MQANLVLKGMKLVKLFEMDLPYRIYKRKVVTLVAFNLEGAFNGFNKVSLDPRLEQRGYQ
jgi:hypothetical protein